MARWIYQGQTKDGNGHVIQNATVSVYIADSYIPANVFTVVAGGSAVNSVLSNASGYFAFFVDDTIYTSSELFRIVISCQNYQSQIYDYIVIIPGGSGGGSFSGILTGSDGHTWLLGVDTVANSPNGRLTLTQLT